MPLFFLASSYPVFSRSWNVLEFCQSAPLPSDTAWSNLYCWFFAHHALADTDEALLSSKRFFHELRLLASNNSVGAPFEQNCFHQLIDFLQRTTLNGAHERLAEIFCKLLLTNEVSK
jgi:hypothetical protein